MSMPFIERMATIRNVAWGRDPSGDYWVQWEQDGQPNARVFRTARTAEDYARWLDTTGMQVSAADVRKAEKALRELEEEVFELGEERREELRELGVPMIRTPREARRIERALAKIQRPVRVRRYPRRT